MSNIFKSIVIFPLLLMLTACATIISGPSQRVNVQAINEQDNSVLSNVSCIVMDAQGFSYPVTGNPGSVAVNRGNGSLQVDCKKEGYDQASIGAAQSFNPVAIVNVLFWPGFIVDAVSGSYARYPSYVVVQMVQSDA